MEHHWEYFVGGVHRGAVLHRLGEDHWDEEAHWEEFPEHARDAMAFDFDFEAAVESDAVIVRDPAYVVPEIER